MSDPVKCRYCPAMVIWAKTGDGKSVPLDARNHPIYMLMSDGHYERITEGVARITHFATCPGASKASADAKAKREGGAT